MGWLWDSNSQKDASASTDPFRDLDPSLRDFLEKESPVKYKPATSPPSPSTSPAQAVTAASETSPPSPAVPSASLYPDGRYAHLWKTYKPLSEVENATKTDQERLLDILHGYKERKAHIARTALENCSLEQLEVNDCFNGGGLKARMTMCRAENRKFERCYLSQTRFLRALGYLSQYDRPPEVDEQIQMHADKLYHRMLDQERAVEEAKAAGLPVPTFPPILHSRKAEASSSSTTNTKAPAASTTASATAIEDEAVQATIKRDQLAPGIQKQLEERFKGLTPEEREIEEKAIAGEIAAGEKVARQVGDWWAEQEKAQKERREKGKETVTDKISGWFGR